MSLRDVLLDELRDLYSAENQQIKAMPKAVKAVESSELRDALSSHLEQTKEQVNKLRQCFEHLGKKATGKHCDGMEGAIKEVKEALEEDAEGASFDSGVIGAVSRVEHYETAGYTVALAIAKALGEAEIADMLRDILDEEKAAAKNLMAVAKGVFKQAVAEEGQEEEPESKPKKAKEKRSEKESEEDEKEAEAEMHGESSEEDEEAAEKPARKSPKKSAKKTTKKK